MKTIVLAHYYVSKEVQDMADYVGDSLDLSQKAANSKADRIVFAGVRFMAETAKMLSPNSEVILPDWNSTCSLVEQTDTIALGQWRRAYFNHTHVMYINSSVEQKALADWIVTSRNVEPIVKSLLDKGQKVIFSPDRNMGIYLSRKLQTKIPSWSAVCEVHDQFDKTRLRERFAKYGRRHAPYLIAHPESPISILEMADYINSTAGMLEWVDKIQLNAPDEVKLDVFVATEFELVRMMRERRPDLNIYQVPVIGNCRCNECPYMKLNTVQKVRNAIAGKGIKIDYLSKETMRKALIPVQRMMNFSI